ncbi:MAG: Glutamyl-tRNA(Gln) amidotransferase subunit A [Chlamydiae bacterium]|nr:Glutamyl-tRNA(Gln) amidotransferase subunit A [Chlamydiota bacterium]
MLHTLTARELHDKFCSGELSATEITAYFLDRIESHNESLGAFVTILRERALEKAAELDQKRERGDKLGKLAGIPIALKDNMNVEGVTTTCSSQFLTNFTAPYDATITKLIENEDGIIVGKTNLDEFAMGSSTENSSLFPTLNPWNLKCSPGGSSGGSAAAVAARLVPLALGSDTGGSIRQPASLCGITGYKPTYGRVSRYGLVAFGSSLDQIGPLATNTQDAALLMEVIGRHCDRDSTSIPEGPENYLEKMAERQDLKGMKFGIPNSFLEKLTGKPRETFDQAIEKMKELGAEFVDVDLSLLKYAIAIYYILATAEASTNLARFDGIRYGVRSANAETLDQIYDLSKEEGFGPEVKRRIMLGTYVLSAGYKDAYYKKAQKVRTLMIEQFEKAFEKCDLIVMPTSPASNFELGSIKDPLQMYLEDIYTVGSNLVGSPTISIPCGFLESDKPFGLQFVGPQKQDTLVFQAASVFENATDYHNAHPTE